MIETGKQSENVSSMDLMEDMSPDKLLSIQKAKERQFKLQYQDVEKVEPL